jgi:hypothetical protein
MRDLSKRQQALLVRLADGALVGPKRERAEASLGGIVDLEQALARQRRVAEALRGGPVPQGAALELPTMARPSRQRLRTLRVPALAAALAAAAIAALVLALQPTSPSVTSAAGLGMLPAEGPAPTRSADALDEPLLAGGIEGVAFPDWHEVFGWHARGSRDDVIDGRETRTVFYVHMGHRIGYTIVAGGTLDIPEGAEIVRRNGVEIALFRDGPRDIAVFVRDGLTCILSGEVMARATLVKLAAWHADGTIEF